MDEANPEDNETETAETPAVVKQEIAREYSDLASVMETTATAIAELAKPPRFIGRWFHTSTS